MEAKLLHAQSRAIALAALYVLESLLLELEARGILQEHNVQGLLNDAAKTLKAAGMEIDAGDRSVAGEIIETIRMQHERVSG